MNPAATVTDSYETIGGYRYRSDLLTAQDAQSIISQCLGEGGRKRDMQRPQRVLDHCARVRSAPEFKVRYDCFTSLEALELPEPRPKYITGTTR